MLEKARKFLLALLTDTAKGATFVSYKDMVALHLDQSHVNIGHGMVQMIKEVNNKDTIVHTRCSWSRIIDILQMEDKDRYNMQFHAIMKFKSFSQEKKASMMT